MNTVSQCILLKIKSKQDFIRGNKSLYKPEISKKQDNLAIFLERNNDNFKSWLFWIAKIFPKQFNTNSLVYLSSTFILTFQEVKLDLKQNRESGHDLTKSSWWCLGIKNK